MVEPILAGLSVTMAPAFSRAATLSDAAPMGEQDIVSSTLVGSQGYPLTLAAGNDGTSVTHAPAGGRSAAGDETNDRLGLATRFVVLLEVLRGLLLHTTTNLTDEDNACKTVSRADRMGAALCVPSVRGSSRKSFTTSMCFVPGKGSPPMPTTRDWPRPTPVVCATASYVKVPERETIPSNRKD